jgi:putative nucleotidyltransferase with HDIG domain
MNRADVDVFKNWFATYVAGFRTGDPVKDRTIALKEAHTRRVCKEIIMIARSLELSPHDLILAETIALFHDVGRFRQYREFGTFNDAASRNHAELGLEELAEHQVLNGCAAEERKRIRRAIRCHNVRVLSEERDEQVVFFARLVRDADKLDIWRVFVDYYEGRYSDVDSTVVWGLPDEQSCSSKITDALLAQEMADTKHMATLNDFKLLQISWIFDVNFIPTFCAVRRRRYIDKIAATLPRTDIVQKAVGRANAYLLTCSAKEPDAGRNEHP